MKKVLCCILAAALMLGLSINALAAERTECIVSADSVSAVPGKTVTVPIRISGNPGFNNFALTLEYDQQKLKLLSIQTADGEISYLCGETASANPEWTDEKTSGYIAAASAEDVSGDGILFTATFQVSDTFSGTASVLPVIRYLRTNRSLFPIFDNISAQAESGTVTAGLLGDFDRNGTVNVLDVMGLYNAIGEGQTFTQDDLARLDANQDGKINVFDAMTIYDFIMGGR